VAVRDLAGIPISLLPVTVFLVALVVMDSYKLVRPAAVIRSVLAGSIVAAACLLLHAWFLDNVSIEHGTFSRYVAPVTEELLKAAYVAALIRRGKVGFSVDAAIHGFAVGTGFALVENVYYLRSLSAATVFLWAVRGFGTAMIHGSTSAIFAIIAKVLTDLRPRAGWPWYLPGLGVAIAAHSAFNHFILPPLAMAAVIMLVMPMLVLAVFYQSERATRRWLGTGFDTDMELRELTMSDRIHDNPVGKYLNALKQHFSGTVVADMLCLLRIQTELAMRAKALLMARQVGVNVAIGDDVKENLEELRYLEKSIGPTGRLALDPFLKTSSRDLWQFYMLGR
jgi:RsiW-degrading membrane proteinase PrsW (M82 family)